MMRKVTQDVCAAFIAGKGRVRGNTYTDGNRLLLHGNCIAWRDSNGSVFVTLAGWPTVTTRERLNGLCELLGLGRPFHQMRHNQYFKGECINSTDCINLDSGAVYPASMV